jgi:hypothetical protein
MTRRLFLASVLSLGATGLAAQIPVPVPLAEDIAYHPLGGSITRNAANGNYVVTVDASAYGRAGITYVAQAAVVDAAGTEWELDGPGGPGLPDWNFPLPYGGAVQDMRWSQEMPFGVKHPINQYIGANGCVLVRVRLYERRPKEGGGFEKVAVAYDAGWQYP